MTVKSGGLVCAVISDSLPPHVMAHQAPLSMGVPRQEYWSGLPFPSPADLPTQDGTQVPCIAGGFFTF